MLSITIATKLDLLLSQKRVGEAFGRHSLAVVGVHTSMTAWPSYSKILKVARKPTAVAIFLSCRAGNVLDRC